MLSSLHRILAQLLPRHLSYPSCLLSIILPMFVLDGANAASFDCEKASSKVEKLICKSDEISALDEKMASTYREALQHALNPQALRKEQKAWLNLRNLCRPEDIWKDPPRQFKGYQYEEEMCLLKVYQNRVQELQMRYLQPAEKLPSVLEFLAKEKKLKLDLEVEPKAVGQCEDIIRHVRSGQGIEVVHPQVTNASHDSPELLKYLKGCSSGLFSSASVYEHRSSHGDNLEAKTGDVYSPYDSYDLWTLPDSDGKEFMVLYQGPKYFDVARSFVVGDLVPYWVDGPNFMIIAQPGCKLSNTITTTPWPGPSGGNAPPERRQSEIIKYKKGVYLLDLGNMADYGNPDYHILRINKLITGRIHELCTYATK